MRIEPDLEKIKVELAQASLSAQKKIAAAAQAYHDSMEDIAKQLIRLKKRA